jgi:class 3 adenylate cyclase
MVDLQVQYVRSLDGTRIALSTLGSGRPFVLSPTQWLGTMEALWEIPTFRDNVQRLARGRMVVLYDHRGQGFSERNVTDLSLDRRIEDLAAVADRVADSRIQLGGQLFSSIVATAYAARAADRVSHLVLWSPLATGRDFRLSPTTRALMTIADFDWQFYVRAQAVVDFGWTQAGLLAGDKLVRGVSAEMMGETFAAGRDMDVSADIPLLDVPTLVIHRNDARDRDMTTSQAVAANIRDALFVTTESSSMSPFVGQLDEEMDVLERFLDEGQRSMERSHSSHSTEIILFADIVDSVATTERMGDAAFRERARALDDALRSAIAAAGGTAIDGKLVGDGVLATFSAASQAIDAALRCAAAGNDGGLPLHLGIHAGDVIREQNNVYGGAVNIASRISALSAPGEVLVSDVVRALARTSAGVVFEDRGEQALKGVADPQRVYAVRATEAM